MTAPSVRVGGQEFRWRPGLVITVGRDPACDVVVDAPQVSRHHVSIEAAAGGAWRLRDAGSRNGVFVGGRRIQGQPLDSPVVINLGGASAAPLAVDVVPLPGEDGRLSPRRLGPGLQLPPPGLQPRPPGPQPPPLGPQAWPADQPPPVAPGRLSESHLGRSVRVFVPRRGVVAIGRDPSNELVLADDPRASRRHAEMRHLADDGWEIRDLGSHNGTFLNGSRVGRAQLSDEDLLTIGNHVFVFRAGQLEQVSDTDDTSLDVAGVTVTTASGDTLLQDVSFSLSSRSVLAVVGPSGAGKSTLLRALTGSLVPSRGHVSFAGRDLHGAYEEFRSRIGLVPQDDLVHPELTPRAELEFAAALRLPPDTGREGRRARVEQVLAELGLIERAGLPVAQLSGGQRKRVSVGTELLTQPTLLFLDEPTSGLDPGNEQQVMSVLRQLADGGRVVVVVTHATQSLDLADRVLFLAKGGRVAYFGLPAAALDFFARNGVTGGYADIFRALDHGGADWPARFVADPAHDRFVGIAARQAEARREAARRRPTARAASPVSASGQFGVLLRRQARILRGDRRTLLLLAGQPLAFGLIIAALFPAGTMSTEHGPFAALMLWLLVVSATWLGASGTVREIVKELPVFRRERAVGLSIAAYVGSKAAVFGAITVVQSFVVVVLGLARQTLPALDPRGFVPLVLGSGRAVDPGQYKGLRPFAAGSAMASQGVEVVIAVALAGLAGTALGLAISALVRKSDQAVFLLPVVLVVQMALSLPLLKLQRVSPLLQLSSKIASANWGMNAVASTVSLNQILTPYLWDLSFGQASIAGILAARGPFVPTPHQFFGTLKINPSWQHTAPVWLTSALILVIMIGVLLGVAVAALSSQDVGRKGGLRHRRRPPTPAVPGWARR